MKKYKFLFLFGLLMFGLTFLVSLNFFDKTKKELVSDNLQKARTYRDISQNNSIIKETNSDEVKIGINTKIRIQKKYKKCNHIVEEENVAEKEMVNLSLEEFEKKYPEYSVKEFSKEMIVVEQNLEGFCDEHFKIGIGEDFVEVYRMNSEEEEELYLVTNISRDYLAQKDIDKLSKGIVFFGKEKINSMLEDYE